MNTKKKRKWWKVLLIILLVFVLAIGGLAIGGYLYVKESLHQDKVGFVDKEDLVIQGTDKETSGSVTQPGDEEKTGETVNPDETGEGDSREDEIPEDVVPETVPIIREEQIQKNIFNVLLVGSDSRDPAHDAGRSDTMMLISFNETDGSVTAVSFMRDSLVEIPGYGKTKLGHSYAYGGVGLTINTINQNYGLDIQNYVMVNFENLINIIDIIGGIEVELTEQEAGLYNAYLKTDVHVPGVNRLDGKTALIHARDRELTNDFDRTRRQRDVIKAIYEEVMNEPVEIPTLISYCLTQVKTNLEMDQIYTMAMKVLQAGALNIQQTTIPAENTYTYDKYDGLSVLNVDVDANKQILHDLLYGE